MKLVIESACKTFGDHLVLDHVPLTCESGKIYGFVGYNGCGKTVLFKCICGFLSLDQGNITVDGQNPEKWLKHGIRLGAIIEEPAFLKEKSALQNLEYLYCVNHKPNREYLYEMLRKVGLSPTDKKHVGNYSMGMKQRLAIAQAIMEDPDILILDEPMNGLDRTGVLEMRALFKELQKNGKIILLASHNREDISELCNEIYEMDKTITMK